MNNYYIHKILIPIDFSMVSANVLETGLSICKSQFATMDLMHIMESAPETSSTDSDATGLSDRVKHANEVLTEMAKEIRVSHNVVVTHFVHLGNPAEEICHWASLKKIDLIVLGSHESDKYNDFFLGSNAYQILKNAPCPVMVVRPIVTEI
ncbi:MAG: universal stress protein [Saprospiraceae bacterium]